jgi:orotidine-5'-phosphate decarboxylase
MTATADRLIVALDHSDPGAALECVGALGGTVRWFKVGSVLFTNAGPPFIRDLVEVGHGVFLDLKFHDTPATVSGAVSSAADLGVGLLTLHASGGTPMLEAAREAADRASRPPALLAVTVLPSLDPEEFLRIAGPESRPLPETVIALALLARSVGIDGCVCSPHEVEHLRREMGPEPLLVIPGIRPTWSLSDHRGQARTATPAEAMRAGASHLVVGRAITGADDPLEAARRVQQEMIEGIGDDPEGPPSTEETDDL